jgi:hypothetical protein
MLIRYPATPTMTRPKRTILLTVSGATIVGLVVWAFLPAGRAFDAAVWRDNSKPLRAGGPKQQMADRIVARKVLIGQHRDEVIAMLGAPTDDGEGHDLGGRLDYFLGPERGMFGVDTEILTVELDDQGRVTRCYIRHT